ncbi:MAG: transcription elongation factor GreA [Trueperaceae bacterium]|nr:MAG: transcription elongation factor GreA [Trueperaceae bacterium]
MSDRKPIQLTAKGLEKLTEELRYLKDEKRQELTEYMGAALADGDLRENAAYDEARMLQSANEARIADLEEVVNRAVVVETSSAADAPATLGASLHVEDDEGAKHVFHLVGSLESDVLQNRISDESPLGQQLLGRRAGDEIALGSRRFKVVSILFE